MRIQQIVLPVSLLFCFAGAGVAQNTPRFELFVEGGGSFLNTGPTQGSLTITCSNCALSQVVPLSSSITTAGRLFTGARFRFTRHDAIEASYSFSTNHFAYRAENVNVELGYTRLDLVSFNYVRYLWVRSRFQPFATAGIGTNRFRGGPGVWFNNIRLGSPEGNILSLADPADNGWQFAWNYGAGADLILPFHFALRFELRNYVGDQPVPLTGTSHNLVPSGGVVFRFK